MTKTDTHKKAMLEALEKSLGIVSTAVKDADITRATHYEWLKKDKNYKQAVQDISEQAIDFAESKLYKLINDHNVTAIIFYLKTKGKSRGYIERAENINYNTDSDEKFLEMQKKLREEINSGNA